jgi:hypothetical protein
MVQPTKDQSQGNPDSRKVTATLAKILLEHRPDTLRTPAMQDISPWQKITLEYESFEKAR